VLLAGEFVALSSEGVASTLTLLEVMPRDVGRQRGARMVVSVRGKCRKASFKRLRRSSAFKLKPRAQMPLKNCGSIEQALYQCKDAK
jgi:hypothetical protein